MQSVFLLQANYAVADSTPIDTIYYSIHERLNRCRPVILITGAHGFIGRQLAKVLILRGNKIRILTRGRSSNLQGIGGQVDVWQGDLTITSTISGIADGIDTVYHLAGEIRNRRRFTNINHQGTQNLLAQCESSGVRRFLHLSSAGVMGASGKNVALNESHSAFPRNEYEISKYAGEKAVIRQHNQDRMQVSVIRPTIVYGENPKSDSFLRWLRLIRARCFFQLGQDVVNTYVYVGDVVAACLTVANDSRTGGEIYFVNEPIPLSHLIAELSNAIGVKVPREFPRFLGNTAEKVLRRTGRFSSLYNYTIYRMDKLTDLGFALPFGYREGVRRTVEWYRKRGLV